MEKGKQGNIQRTKDPKVAAKDFLFLMKKEDFTSASGLVLSYIPKDIRVDLIIKKIEDTSLRCYRQELLDLKKHIIDIRNGEYSLVKMDILINKLDSKGCSSWKEANFYQILTSLLRDLRDDRHSYSAEAVNRLFQHYEYKNKVVQQLLYDLAGIAWPDKGMIGAIYG